MGDIASAFLGDHAARLRGLYVDRIERAVAPLEEAHLWWRPHDGTTSIGILLRHLEGNIRQWLCSGLGGRTDRRTRAAEFASAERPAKSVLLDALRATAQEAAGVVEGLDEAALLGTLRIQGIATTGYGAVAHVLEHMSWHTGQIVWIAKARLGPAHGISFYDDTALDAARNG
jgi:uncharacterized damage-inducible protein DinB